MAVLILCIIMTVIFLAMPLIILLFGVKNKQMSIIKVSAIWFIANIILVIVIWILYGTLLSRL